MYLKPEDNYRSINEYTKQTWAKKFTSNISKNEIIKMKNEGELTDRDLEISKFLFNVRFATLEQIHRYLQDDSSINGLRTRLDKLVNNRVVNKFMIGLIEEEAIHEDALIIYCLDIGGRYLIENFTSEDATDWYFMTNMKSPELIAKDLNTTDFYLNVRDTCKSSLLFFNSSPELRVFKRNLVPNFEFCLQNGIQRIYFVGEVVRDLDLPNKFVKKIEKYEELLTTNTWKKYYSDGSSEPILLLIVENDEMALEASKILSEREIKNFRLTTDERMYKVLYESGAFLKYVPEQNKLKPVKATSFKPTE